MPSHLTWRPVEVTAKVNTIFLAKFRAEYKIFMFIERLGNEGRKDRVVLGHPGLCGHE